MEQRWVVSANGLQRFVGVRVPPLRLPDTMRSAFLH